MDFTDYDLVTGRLDAIDTQLAWLDARGRDPHDQTLALEQERALLAAELDHIELRYSYDAALMAS